MLTIQRRALISARLNRDGQLVAKLLADELNLSEDTIRRDLREMAAEGLLKRVHGGAMPLTPPLPDFAARQEISGDMKQRLGHKAASLVSNGQTIFLDGGTTNTHLARALPREMRITVVTHSPTIASELEHHEAEVILIGGKLYKHSMVAVGASTLSAINQIRLDIFFLGVTAIHPVYGLSTGNYEEAAIKQAIVQQAAETYVLSTPEKFGAASPFRITGVESLAGVVVDGDMMPEPLAAYRELGVEILPA
ncbi:DeoR/GlpR family DNA-binding transcription regulator [Phyllobacterium zundukense]|uniref:DeoR family transcriptional regulator n=1 Tax=Phyllobacterium zundukense TaxID=1867719 RepID=A0A2N9VXX6_9HYPH|nr:DeoR/GlpR family DNA-binding transcription regulator [Phyllobacterium zundukense]ATU95653.1 DeoR family transcriptional regulator [Phyllobacterium zundukense]PIO44344.1 DeoR family transcriptional regulator [Phyllobacterium zundukense]